jgi:formylglycine-generating enzyme required for sulfatase activity
MRIVWMVLVSLGLLSVSQAAPEMKVPAGCRAAPEAKPGYDGYADRVVHEKAGLELVLVAPGTFHMGAEGGENSSSCAPVHPVTFAQPFYLGRTEVTNGSYRKFAATGYDGTKEVDPAYDLYLLHLRGRSIMPTGDDYPVIYVSWHHAKAFCAWAGGLDLPTEAEWEYACRAGTTATFSFGEDLQELDQYAWTLTNSQALPHPVAQLAPNPGGLYDLHGNVWEWTRDDYVYRYDGAPADGSARVEGRRTKVLRGGSWSNAALVVTQSSAARFNSAPGNASNDVGFRVVLRLP